MTVEQLKRGNKIQDRIHDLDKIHRLLSDTERRGIYINQKGRGASEAIMLPDDMSSSLLTMCIVERKKSIREFEEL